MLASDVNMYADGGGKRPAAPHPLLGHSAVMRTLGAISKLLRDHPSQLLRACWINGLPGFVTLEADGAVQTTAVEFNADGQVSGVYVVRNPDKLGRVG
jgi:RNA polymerase sigma-70 factor (ECF subfamily)